MSQEVKVKEFSNPVVTGVTIDDGFVMVINSNFISQASKFFSTSRRIIFKSQSASPRVEKSLSWKILSTNLCERGKRVIWLWIIDHRRSDGIRFVWFLLLLRSALNSRSSQDVSRHKPDCPTALIFGSECFCIHRRMLNFKIYSRSGFPRAPMTLMRGIKNLFWYLKRIWVNWKKFERRKLKNNFCGSLIVGQLRLTEERENVWIGKWKFRYSDWWFVIDEILAGI